MRSFLLMCICLVHIAASGTRNRVLRHSSYDGLSEEGGVRTRTASELEYRRWRPLDMFRNKPMFRVKGGRRFVAVDPTTSNNVVGFVEYVEESPGLANSAVPHNGERGSIIYIAHVFVREDWQGKKVGTMMLSKTLEDVSVNHNVESHDTENRPCTWVVISPT